jgi:hypothetical protein
MEVAFLSDFSFTHEASPFDGTNDKHYNDTRASKTREHVFRVDERYARIASSIRGCSAGAWGCSEQFGTP